MNTMTKLLCNHIKQNCDRLKCDSRLEFENKKNLKIL